MQEQQREVAFDGNCHCVERGVVSCFTEVEYGGVYLVGREKRSALNVLEIYRSFTLTPGQQRVLNDRSLRCGRLLKNDVVFSRLAALTEVESKQWGML